MLAQLVDDRIITGDGACVVERVPNGVRLHGLDHNKEPRFAFEIEETNGAGERRVTIHDHLGSRDFALEGELYITSETIRIKCMIAYITLEGEIRQLRFVPNH